MPKIYFVSLIVIFLRIRLLYNTAIEFRPKDSRYNSACTGSTLPSRLTVVSTGR